jgi:hypothetical protein
MLGRTGVHVSPLCLGATMFGAWGETEHDTSIRIIPRALDAGVNFIDTADVYSMSTPTARAHALQPCGGTGWSVATSALNVAVAMTSAPRGYGALGAIEQIIARLPSAASPARPSA